MDGTEKLPLLIIGKALKPRCFKNIRTLPAEYTANSKAWMTREIFKQWLIKLDRKFELAHRSVLLVVDNCSAHVVDVDLKAIKLSFLPPNTTAALQPMDQGVIKNLKCFYRRHMLERLVLCAAGTKGYDVTLLSAMHMLVRAWDQVTATTVANCFRHSGFCVAIEGTAGELDEREADVIPAGLRDALGDVNFGDYVDADRSAVVCGTITDDDIIAQVTGEEALVVDVGEDEEDEAPTRPTASEVMEAMRVARLFFSFEEDEEDAFRHTPHGKEHSSNDGEKGQGVAGDVAEGRDRNQNVEPSSRLQRHQRGVALPRSDVGPNESPTPSPPSNGIVERCDIVLYDQEGQNT
nr:tigger transposable element-derived protein 6-like [Rhipicephalus microplus]